MRVLSYCKWALILCLLTACNGESEGKKRRKEYQPEEANTPEKCIKMYYELIEQGDCEVIQDMVSGEMTETIQALSEMGCQDLGDRVKSVDCESSDETAKCECKVKNKAYQGQAKVSFELQKEDDRWLILRKTVHVPPDARVE